MCRLNENDVLENYGGAIQNSLETIFTNVQDDDEGGSSPITQHSTFLNPYDPDIEKFLEFNQDNFTVYSQNIDQACRASNFCRKPSNKTCFSPAFASKRPEL